MLAVTIVVVLYLLYLTGGAKNRQLKLKTACQKNLQNTYVALRTYAVENREAFPVTTAPTAEGPLSLLIPRCTTSTELFICPGSDDKVPPKAQPFDDRKISYAYYMGRRADAGPDVPLLTDEQVNTESKQLGQLLFSDTGTGPGSNHDRFGGVILFTDGSTRVTDTNAPISMELEPGITLLNPKP